MKSQSIPSRILTEKEKVEFFSYQTAFLIAQQKGSFSDGETVIKPAIKSFVEIFNSKPFDKKINEATNEASFKQEQSLARHRA